jgi:hypothetical protein
LKEAGKKIEFFRFPSYMFNDAYLRMLAKADRKAAGKLRPEYLAFTSAENRLLCRSG